MVRAFASLLTRISQRLDTYEQQTHEDRQYAQAIYFRGELLKRSGLLDRAIKVVADGGVALLDVLTPERAKPAMPFGGVYRLIDFPLSNCVNSGITRIGNPVETSSLCSLPRKGALTPSAPTPRGSPPCACRARWSTRSSPRSGTAC